MPRTPTRSAAKGRDRLVVIGASAGGIEALSVLASGLTKDFPAPIVVAQHLHPDHPSSLTEIISRRTDLEVVTVTDRMPLRPGTIHIVPPNRHVAVTDHEIRLETGAARRPKPSVDHLLETSAEIFGDRLIAVILSGTGSDGAAGAQYVAAAGGTVIAQDPETAWFPAMPRSLSPATVDAVTRLEAIGPLLEALVLGTTTVKEGDRSLQRFLGQLRDRTGIDFAAYKRPTVIRRIERRMAATKSATLADYHGLVLRQPEELHRLTSSLLIKVTSFFRDADLFDHLRTAVLPRLIDEARSGSRDLRFWSAGCATGEEAYSLAILVAEALGPDLAAFNVRIFATDADPEAISFARRGVYPTSAMKGIPPELLRRYFVESDGEHEVSSQIRAMTVFGEHDLSKRAPFPRIDLILCRNVLIYFTAELQRRALQLFAFALRDGGTLVLGKSETTTAIPGPFVAEEPNLKIYRRTAERTLMPTGAILAGLVSDAPRPRLTPKAPALDGPISLRSHPDEPTATERAQAILHRIPLGVAVVDGSYDIETINATARSLLGIHGAAIGQDFIHHARSLDSRRLRAAIDAALAGKTSVHEFDVTSETPVGVRRVLSVTVAPLSFGGKGGPDRNALVSILDVSEERATMDDRVETVARQEAEVDRLRSQLERLLETNNDLLQGNEELAAENLELRTANQELLVYSEEVQAATEEVETLNEELQATNEELETLNEELQATVEELNAAHDDLAMRADGATAAGAGADNASPRGGPALTLVEPIVREDGR